MCSVPPLSEACTRITLAQGRNGDSDPLPGQVRAEVARESWLLTYFSTRFHVPSIS